MRKLLAILLLRGIPAFAIVLAIACLGVMCVSNAHAQTAPTAISNTFQIKPQTITTSSAVDLCSLKGGPPCHADVYVCWFSAYTASNATTISDADEQASPVTHDSALAIAANTRYNLIAGSDEGGSQGQGSSCVGEWFPGGMTITAGNANYLTVYVRGKWWAGPALF